MSKSVRQQGQHSPTRDRSRSPSLSASKCALTEKSAPENLEGRSSLADRPDRWVRGNSSAGRSLATQAVEGPRATGSAAGMQIVPQSSVLATAHSSLNEDSSFGSPDGQIISVKPTSRVHIGKGLINASVAISLQGNVNIAVGAPPGLVADLSAQLEATRAQAREVLIQQDVAHQQEKLAMREEAVRVVAASQIDANARVNAAETNLQAVQQHARQQVAGIQASVEIHGCRS